MVIARFSVKQIAVNNSNPLIITLIVAIKIHLKEMTIFSTEQSHVKYKCH